MTDYIVGVDGGNSKTDVVVVSTTGRVLSRVLGPGVGSPLQGLDAWRDGLAGLVQRARSQAGLPATSRARCGVFMLANVDLAEERRLARRHLAGLSLCEQTFVHNDTLAVLRAGAGRGWGVALVAGAGINGVGVHPNGRIARFLALGGFTGDSGGGQDIGVQGLGSAVRSRDGRGPATVLATLIPRHFGLRTPEDVAIAVHKRTIAHDDLHVLAPIVFAAAEGGDGVAIGIISAFATEVGVMAGALIRRLRLSRTDVEVVLGGGTLQTGDQAVLDLVRSAITRRAPEAQVSVLSVPPVVGAVVEAFDQLKIGAAANTRMRMSLPAYPARKVG